jgi:integrase
MQLWKKKAPQGIHAYDLRHYFATHAVRAGWAIEKLSKYLGHSSVTTTQRYYADMRALTEVGAPPVLT